MTKDELKLLAVPVFAVIALVAVALLAVSYGRAGQHKSTPAAAKPAAAATLADQIGQAFVARYNTMPPLTNRVTWLGPCVAVGSNKYGCVIVLTNGSKKFCAAVSIDYLPAQSGIKLGHLAAIPKSYCAGHE
jgi:hypothetical protein